jgi:hypothetical protein
MPSQKAMAIKTIKMPSQKAMAIKTIKMLSQKAFSSSRDSGRVFFHQIKD